MGCRSAAKSKAEVGCDRAQLEAALASLPRCIELVDVLPDARLVLEGEGRGESGRAAASPDGLDEADRPYEEEDEVREKRAKEAEAAAKEEDDEECDEKQSVGTATSEERCEADASQVHRRLDRPRTGESFEKRSAPPRFADSR